MYKKDLVVGKQYEVRLDGATQPVLLEEIAASGTASRFMVKDKVGAKFVLRSALKFIKEVQPTPVVVVPEKKVPTSRLASRLASSSANSGPFHMVIKAYAGTGKTTTLIEGLKHMRGIKTSIKPSDQQAVIWDALALSGPTARTCMVAFNKSIAKTLQARVPSNVSAMTMHSMGLRAVKDAWKLLPGEAAIDGWKVQTVLSELMGMDLRELRRMDSVLVSATDKLVGLCKMGLLDATEENMDWICDHYDIELEDRRETVFGLVPQVLEICKDVSRHGYIDFNDMIWIPVVHKLAITKYALLCVDESQDLSPCQQSLAVMAAERLVMCGDSNQAIYGFTGADTMSMPRMFNHLAATERGCNEYPLTVTRRCAKAIVREAQSLVKDFKAHESNGEGFVKYATMKSQGKCQDCFCPSCLHYWAETITENNPEATKCPSCKLADIEVFPVRDTAYKSIIEPGDMVVCRVNAPLVSECFKFLKEDIKAQIQGRDIGAGLINLIKKFGASTINSLVTSLDQWLALEIAKENSRPKPSEVKFIALQDRYDCLRCFCDEATTVQDVVNRIERIFTDNSDTKSILLSSGHKAKGLEAPRVCILQPPGCTCPHPMAKTAWQREQEFNIFYVMKTRAIDELVYVR